MREQCSSFGPGARLRLWGRQERLDKRPCIAQQREGCRQGAVCSFPLVQNHSGGVVTGFMLVERRVYEEDAQTPCSPGLSSYTCLACSLLSTISQGKLFSPPSGFLLIHMFSTVMFLPNAIYCPSQSCAACSRRWYPFPMGDAILCCTHSLLLLIQGLGSPSIDFDSL